MKYKPFRTYELTPESDFYDSTEDFPIQQDQFKSKAERLRELKQLLDEKVITQEEFDKEKKKILNEDN